MRELGDNQGIAPAPQGYYGAPRIDLLHVNLDLVAQALAGMTPRPDWKDDQLCPQVDPYVFFPEKSESANPAKKICGMCEVTLDCLNDAINIGEEMGVRGGLTARERVKLQKLPNFLSTEQ